MSEIFAAVTSSLGTLVIRGGRLRAEPTGGIDWVKLSDGEPLRDTSGLVRLGCARSSLGLVVLEMERAVPHAVPLGQVRPVCARCLLGFVVHAWLRKGGQGVVL